MVITNIKIEVTYKMMLNDGLTQCGKIGVPKLFDGINYAPSWVKVENLTEEDFNLIEEYYIKKNGFKICKHT